MRSESGRYESPARQSTSRAARARTCATRSPPRAGRPRPWAARTAYNRGQILYRAAETLESPREPSWPRMAWAASEVDGAVDVLVYYAGWTDKLQAVLGGINPVAAPFLSFTVPEPTGVVGVVAPDEPALLGLVAELAPALAAGNTVVAILSEPRRCAGLDLAEVLGVGDIPAGVVNLLSGRRAELAPALGAHMDVNAIVDARRRRRARRPSSTGSPPRRSSAPATARSDDLRRGGRRRARADRRGHRAEDRLASGRRVADNLLNVTNRAVGLRFGTTCTKTHVLVTKFACG